MKAAQYRALWGRAKRQAVAKLMERHPAEYDEILTGEKQALGILRSDGDS